MSTLSVCKIFRKELILCVVGIVPGGHSWLMHENLFMPGDRFDFVMSSNTAGFVISSMARDVARLEKDVSSVLLLLHGGRFSVLVIGLLTICSNLLFQII